MSELNQIKPVAEEKVKKSFGQIFSDLSMPILLVLLIIFFTIMSDKFFTGLNLTNILVQNVHTAVCTTGVFIIMVSGGCDLSIGYQMSVAAVLVAKLLSNGVVSVPVAIANPPFGIDGSAAFLTSQ